MTRPLAAALLLPTAARSACPAGEQAAADDASGCECSPGYIRSPGGCVPCDAGYFKQDAGDSLVNGLGICPDRCTTLFGALASSPPGATSKSDCFCVEGAVMMEDARKASGWHCWRCEECDGEKMARASSCPGGKAADAPADLRVLECSFQASGEEVACPTPVPVEPHTESVLEDDPDCGEGQVKDSSGCTCNKGYFKDLAQESLLCLPCEEGWWKSEIGDGVGRCTERCSEVYGEGATSKSASTSPAACFCLPDWYMAADGDSETDARCVKSASCSDTFAFKGGLTEDGKFHATCTGTYPACEVVIDSEEDAATTPRGWSGREALFLAFLGAVAV